MEALGKDKPNNVIYRKAAYAKKPPYMILRLLLSVFTVPGDIGSNDIHLVQEVRDNGSQSLVAYRRVVIREKNRE